MYFDFFSNSKENKLIREEMGVYGLGMRWDIVRFGVRRKYWRVEGEEKLECVGRW